MDVRPRGSRVSPDARWLTAEELRHGVHLETGREHVLVISMPRLEISGPDASTLWITHPAAGGYVPRMPNFAGFRVRVTGVQVDPTPNTTFTWTARLEYETLARTPHRTSVEYVATAVGTAAPNDLLQRQPGRILLGGSQRYPVHTAATGGTLTVSVTAVVDGQQVRGALAGYQVLVAGPHPPASAFRRFLEQHLAATDADWLSRILCVETGARQFRVGVRRPGRYTREGHPVMNVNPGDGGAGVGQVTNRPGQPTVAGPAELWDWRANLEGAIAIYREKGDGVASFQRLVARRVGQSVDHSSQGLVRNVNVARRAAGLPPLARVHVPGLTDAQMRDDQARGYNGYIGPTGQFGLGWHEFRLATEGEPARLTVDNVRTTNGAWEADARWVRVAPGERPRRAPTPDNPTGAIGNPNYVADVGAAACQ